MSFPFKDAVARYRNKGWFGTLPLPKGKKEKPPEGWTGKKAKFPDREKIIVWIAEDKYQDGNICLRLARIDDEWEVIGIDVDHYESGGKQKLGGDQLRELEAKLGPLPETWISTARTDGISGIRYFLVPRGLGFKGKAAKDIDIVSKGYRYALVWPSIHPNGDMYQWYKGWVLQDDIPDARTLPVLPDPWLDYLTSNRTPFTVDAIDMEPEPDELYEWAANTFTDVQGPMCHRMAQKVELAKSKIAEDPSSHDKVTNFHWNLTNLAAEGHAGFNTALKDIEVYWLNNVGNRSKRTLETAKGELRRSRLNALRKVKAMLDSRIKKGIEGVPPDDPECVNFSTGLKDVDGYRPTDDGNGEHLHDLKQIDGYSTIFYVSDWKKWIVWDQETNRWMIDDEDGGLIRREWWDVKFRQEAFVEQLKANFDAEVAAAVSQGAPARGSAAAVPNSLILARNKWQKWDKFVEKSGNNYNADQAIRAAAKRGLTLTSQDLNWNKNVIACSNGVLEIDRDNQTVNFRDQKIDDLITMNTGIEWHDKSDSAGVNYWNQFLDKFLPTAEVQRMIQIAMGYTLLEGNQERIFLICKGRTSTGKSTFVDICGKCLGDYAAPVGKTLFQAHKFKPTLRNNWRRTLVHTTEFDGNTGLSTSVLKEYAGNMDRIEQERKGVDEIDVYELNFVPLIATNEIMNLTSVDDAVLRRIYILPFDEIIKKEDEDKKYGAVLSVIALEAVLHWLVEGLIMYMQRGEKLINNQYTEQLVKDAVIDMGDPYLTFMEEYLELHDGWNDSRIDTTMWTSQPEWCTEGKQFTQHFKAWWFDNDYPAKDLPSAHLITKRFRALGMRKPNETLRPTNRPATQYWLGVRFRPGATIFTIQPGAFRSNTN